MPSSDISEFRRVLSTARNIIILSGAGLSAPSGIATYRGSGSSSLWNDPALKKYSLHTTFDDDPSGSWQFYHRRRLIALSSKPNAAHLAIASLYLPTVKHRIIPHATSPPLHVTQNLDELAISAIDALSHHDREAHAAKEEGKANLIQMHGSLFQTRCLSCKHSKHTREPYLSNVFRPVVGSETGPPGPPDASMTGPDGSLEGAQVNAETFIDIPRESLPRCGGDDWSGSNRYGRCGGLLRPDVVWFGEVPPLMGEIARKVTWCDLLIVVGTSGIVQPAAGFASQVREQGGKVAIFNMEENSKDVEFDFLFLGSCEKVLPAALDVEAEVKVLL
ncbi:sirtuin [Panaeolus papilionaceus]|nr:sirtuin [Panaeolus papilionaceus]